MGKTVTVTLNANNAKRIVGALNNLINRMARESEELGYANDDARNDYIRLRAHYYAALKAAGITEGSLG